MKKAGQRGGEGCVKCAVAVNSDFAWHAENNVRLQEGETCCFHVPKPYPRPLKTSVFTQVGSLGTISVRKKGVKKKEDMGGIKGCSPFNNVTNILISKNKTSSSSFLLI